MNLRYDAHTRRVTGSLLLLTLRVGLARVRAGARVLEHVRQAAVAAVLPVKVRCHEDARPARGALLAEARDLAGAVDLVVLEDMELDLLVLVLDLLRLGVHLLLPLLA